MSTNDTTATTSSTSTSTSTATFVGISVVAIPVSDQDASKRLYEQLGFTTTFDDDVNVGFRWVDMTAPDGGARLALVAAADEPAGVDTGIRFVTPDARAAHATLTGLGLEVGELLDWPTAPLMFEFRDLDGNRLYVAERE